MNRKDFLKAITLAGAAAGAGIWNGVNVFAQTNEAKNDECELAVVMGGEPDLMFRKAIAAFGGMGKFVKPGQKVLIKPNMSFAQGVDSGANTHPDVVREVLIMCKEAGAARVRVLDHSLQNPEKSLQNSGILDACNSVEEGICRHLMDASFYVDADLPAAVEMRSNAFMRDALEADVIIAVPVAKSHGGAGVSLSLKGQMGLIYSRRVMHMRYSLDGSIVDLNTFIKPHLAIIDATRVLTSGGPGGPGLVIRPGEVIASADPVAADATAVASYEWYGRKMAPRQVKYLQLAHDRGLGRMDIENLVTGRVTV